MSRVTDIIEATRGGPVTTGMLVQDLRDLGLRAGSTLIVHSSLSSLGWVVGGAHAVVDALRAALGSQGTIVVPAQSMALSDPRDWNGLWQRYPVPEEWWETIRRTMPAYDPRTTPTQNMGAIVECFRAHPDVVRSAHPQVSFAARGPMAERICERHPLEAGVGEGSPLSVLYELEADVLLLGVGHERNTSLHLAEDRAEWPGRTLRAHGSPLVLDGTREWVLYERLDVQSGDFREVGEAFERETESVQRGSVGAADCARMPIRDLVDYARSWFERNRKAPPGPYV